MSQKQSNTKKGNNELNELIVIKNRPRPKVGKVYQAEIPQCQPLPRPTKNNASQCTDRETLMWDNKVLPEDDVKAYVHKDRGDHKFCSSQDRPTRDNEEALNVLHNYGYNIKKAEKARSKLHQTDCWSDEEKKMFQAGFTEFGKNFAEIREKYLKEKSEHQIINYYYNFKISKSSRSFLLKLENKKQRLRSSSGKKYHQDEFIYY